ncbi:hypothetical protein BCR33DRAFT_770225 [Rhizoclosmatium globosum]|uniref:Uncharacterized protein n=1 Tax=Rhizoclosmatium globosum TaxID=329046 RepID=A0A1Y2BNX2_9FUNG|nr:hypothetical protein BCR33DRAFT_770225 [Rhizoclosmatium globosum]|eukprot:ORY36444.1 hypothetical protein BCR33DRAFT_770225 [Rhizoclosmatium globosum]
MSKANPAIFSDTRHFRFQQQELNLNYIVAYNNPVCGSKAPVILDDSSLNRQKYVFADVTPAQEVYFGASNYTTLFSSLFGVDPSAVLLQKLSAKTFSITVTSNPASPSAENSCVYEYLVGDRFAAVRDFTLVKYDLGGTPLLPNTTIEDGCITKGSTETGPFLFTNTSTFCGDTEPSSRFSRYFGKSLTSFYYLDVADGFFNITVNIPPANGRRDPTTAVFHYADLAFSTTTSTTTSSTTLTSSTSTSSTSTTKSTTITTTTTTTTSAVSSLSSSIATTTSAATFVDAVPTGYAAPTGYVAQPAYNGPTAYGAPAANNIYKGASAGKIGIVSALVTALVFSF